MISTATHIYRPLTARYPRAVASVAVAAAIAPSSTVIASRPSHIKAAPPPFLSTALRSRTSSTQHGTRTMATNGTSAQGLHMQNPTIFICDMQEKFKVAIHEFDKIVLTTKKLLAFASSFSIPVQATTQTVAKLGPTVPDIASLLAAEPHDKTRFSMAIPAVLDALPPASSIALVGIESHICITQSALDLRDAGHHVYVIADGVSSCNSPEVVVALDRLRAEPGMTVTTSESWMYQCLGDASHPGFRELIGIVKKYSADTKTVLASLPPKI